MHSRPIATLWKAEIVHSCPSTDLAPIDASPSCTRTFVPWPIQHQRPSRSLAPRPISSLTPGPTKQSPSVSSRPRQRSFSHAQRSASRAYFGVSIPLRRAKRQNAAGPPCGGIGAPRTTAASGGSVTATICLGQA